MSAEATGYVYRHSPFRGAMFGVHLAIADSVNDQYGNTFWLAKTKLAAKARMTENSAKTALDALVNGGFLEVLEESVGRYPSKFRFLFPEVEVVYESRHTSTPQPLGGSKRGFKQGARQPNPPTSGAQPPKMEPIFDAYKEGSQVDPKSRASSSSVNDALTLVRDHPETGPEAVRLCELLADLIEANGTKRPNVTKTWLTACERLIRIDERTPERIERAIRWCQADPFWRSNILSMPKLRDHYPALRLQALRSRPQPHAGTKDVLPPHAGATAPPPGQSLEEWMAEHDPEWRQQA